MENFSKKDLLEIATKLDLRGFTKLNKDELKEFIINNPCTNLDYKECTSKNREALKIVARKCNVVISKKKSPEICSDIQNKFKNSDLSGIQKLKGVPKAKTPKLNTPTPDRLKTPPKSKGKKKNTPKSNTPANERLKTRTNPKK